MSDDVAVGFYGKLPGHGDFVRRRVSDAFVDRWDRWLQEGLDASRRTLGDAWLDVYLTSPVWRVAADAGVCGSLPFVGVMAPSVDRVGRYFPITIVTSLPREAGSLRAVSSAEEFLTRAERLIVETLASDDVDIDAFDAGVRTLARLQTEVRATPASRLGRGALAVLGGAPDAACRIALAASESPSSAFEQLVFMHLEALYQPAAVFWTDGSARVPPTCLLQRGLPSASGFVALLDGSFDSQWCALPIESRGEPAPGARPALTFRSTGATHVGCVRPANEDAFLARAQDGVWVVADGLGGHRDGEVASRMVCEAMASITLDDQLETGIEAVRERLDQVNAALVADAARAADASPSASTVVTLLAAGGRAAVLWAGDSRAYRWRRGVLEPLTRDHAPAPSADGHQSHGITRAVGVEPNFTLDIVEEAVQSGDRFLLCSDGLTRVVTASELRRCVEHVSIDAAVHALIEAALAAGAPDNVTAVIAEAVTSV